MTGAPTSYRWLRILQNGLDSAGLGYLVLTEFEAYGTFYY